MSPRLETTERSALSALDEPAYGSVPITADLTQLQRDREILSRLELPPSRVLNDGTTRACERLLALHSPHMIWKVDDVG